MVRMRAARITQQYSAVVHGTANLRCDQPASCSYAAPCMAVHAMLNAKPTGMARSVCPPPPSPIAFRCMWLLMFDWCLPAICPMQPSLRVYCPTGIRPGAVGDPLAADTHGKPTSSPHPLTCSCCPTPHSHRRTTPCCGATRLQLTCSIDACLPPAECNLPCASTAPQAYDLVLWGDSLTADMRDWREQAWDEYFPRDELLTQPLGMGGSTVQVNMSGLCCARSQPAVAATAAAADTASAAYIALCRHTMCGNMSNKWYFRQPTTGCPWFAPATGAGRPHHQGWGAPGH